MCVDLTDYLRGMNTRRFDIPRPEFQETFGTKHLEYLYSADCKWYKNIAKSTILVH